MVPSLSLAPRALLAGQAESQLTLIRKLIHSGPRGSQTGSKLELGGRKWAEVSRTRPLLGCRPWGPWGGGWGKAEPGRPLDPETEERFQFPLLRQAASFRPTPRGFAGIETCP